MEYQNESASSISANGLSSPDGATGQKVDFALGFLRRRHRIILIGLLAAVPLGLLYFVATPPSYTASATMIIESQNNQLKDYLPSNSPTDGGWIESQMGILRSGNVAAYVVKQLRLADDPKIHRGSDGPIGSILDRLGLTRPPSTDAERSAAATSAVMRGLDVRRVGLSYMLNIGFRSHDPELATKIANAMVDAYIFEQLNAKYQANRRAGDWLQERLQSLREQAAVAERAVIEFKSKNNIVATSGMLMNEKQLSDTSNQLATARSHSLDIKARLDRIDAVRKAYQQDRSVTTIDETVSEAMASGIINKLQSQYLDLVNREADWTVRYGANHTAVVNIRRQITEIRKSIFEELGRIRETLKSDYEIANKREQEAQTALGSLVSQSTQTNQAQVALFSLEAAAQSYRKLYDNFLQQHTQSVQQQTFPISDARLISSAYAIKTGPQPLSAALLTLFGGLGLGLGLGALREMMDRGFRTRDQVEKFLSTECLALVPRIQGFNARQFSVSRRSGEWLNRQLADPASAEVPRILSFPPGQFRGVADAPSSAYAEAIRAIKLTVDMNGSLKSTKVIGITSCLAGEGKSTIAAGMASVIAQSGARCVLIDGDVRNPTLSRTMAPKAVSGLLEVAVGDTRLSEVLWNDPNTRLAFLPNVRNPKLGNPIDILASRGARELIRGLELQCDYVIVDLPPLISAVDVRTTSTLVDSYILVVEWGVTKVDAVQYALRHAPNVHSKLAGAVLNKVDMDAMDQYDRYGASYYYGQSVDARN